MKIAIKSSDKTYKDIKEEIKISEQKPMQVELEGDGYADGFLVYDYGKCPNCGWQYEEGDKDWEEPFCCHCGQRLKWFEEPKAKCNNRTLDEAIKHCEEVAKKQEEDANYYRVSRCDEKKSISCEKCAEEHRQFAEWLRELKQLREQTIWVPISERLPESDGYYKVMEKSGRVGTYVFHKEGNSEEYWQRCAVAWMPQSFKESEET